MGAGDISFSGLNWLYLLGAGFALYQLQRSWREYFSRVLNARTRQVSAMVAFFLLVPLGVLLHEFGHMLAAWSTGSQVLGLHYFGYWGFVDYLPSSNSPLLGWYVALAGNFVSYALGVVCLLVAVLAKRMLPNFRVTLAQLGLLELVQTLVAYPLLSLGTGFVGDWDMIYSFKAPLASWLTLAVHALSLVGFVLFLRKSKTANVLLRGY